MIFDHVSSRNVPGPPHASIRRSGTLRPRAASPRPQARIHEYPARPRGDRLEPTPTPHPPALENPSAARHGFSRGGSRKNLVSRLQGVDPSAGTLPLSRRRCGIPREGTWADSCRFAIARSKIHSHPSESPGGHRPTRPSEGGRVGGGGGIQAVPAWPSLVFMCSSLRARRSRVRSQWCRTDGCSHAEGPAPCERRRDRRSRTAGEGPKNVPELVPPSIKCFAGSQEIIGSKRRYSLFVMLQTSRSVRKTQVFAQVVFCNKPGRSATVASPVAGRASLAVASRADRATV